MGLFAFPFCETSVTKSNFPRVVVLNGDRGGIAVVATHEGRSEGRGCLEGAWRGRMRPLEKGGRQVFMSRLLRWLSLVTRRRKELFLIYHCDLCSYLSLAVRRHKI